MENRNASLLCHWSRRSLVTGEWLLRPPERQGVIRFDVEGIEERGEAECIEIQSLLS